MGAYTLALIVASWQIVVLHSSAIVGFFMPSLVEIVAKDITNDKERYIVSILICFIAAVLLNWHNIEYGSPESVVQSLAFLFLESNVVFKLWFKNSGARQFIQDKFPGTNSYPPQEITH